MKILQASIRIIFIARITMRGLAGSKMKVIRIIRTEDKGNASREKSLGIEKVVNSRQHPR